jgi:phospholipid/cholesterol/gamma-HCH transport system substrate-binding protein
MENRSHALWAGFFTLALLCVTIFAGVWLNRDQTQRVDYQIATMHAVSGLNPQATVRYKGLEVGRVDQVRLDPETPGQILIDISIDPDTPITQSTFATLSYQGVTGIASIQLDDDGAKLDKISAPGGQARRIPLRPGLFERLESSGVAILANTERVTERLAQLLTPKNQQTMLAAFSSTTEATQHWTQIAEDLHPALEQIPGLVQQTDQTLLSVQALSKSAILLSQQLNDLTRQWQDPNGPMNRSLTHFANLSENIQLDLLPQFLTFTQNASSSFRSFHQTMEELKDRPQSLIFGKPAPLPGPGEAGFVEPGK